jgi:inorganic pyrophosphatase
MPPTPSIGEESPEVVNAVVEIQKGSRNKYEFNEETGVIVLDRILDSAMHYLTDYGFIPETLSGDGDHLDVLVLDEKSLVPGSVVRVRPVGVLKMIDSGKKDYKIIGVEADSPSFNEVRALKDVEAVNPNLFKEVANFFEHYKDKENKEVRILGWGDREEAIREIEEAMKLFERSQ